MLSYMLANTPISGGVSSADARFIAEDANKASELKIQALELTCAAMWTILRDKLGVTEAELVQAIHDVDARDGVVDGKISPISKECPHCHRKALTRNPTKCAWCGGDLSPVGT